jgi:hypothetical protein
VTGSLNPVDYPLKAFGGPFTVDAREAFLRYAPTYSFGSEWKLEEWLEASELARCVPLELRMSH